MQTATSNRLWSTSMLALGAGIMFWLDPASGRRRRVRAFDRLRALGSAGAREIDATARDVGHRLYGKAAEVRALRRHERVSDGVLAQRVRSRLGRVVSHPGAISVIATDGCVTLRGAVLNEEVTDLIGAVRGVRGVREVLSELQVHDAPASVPSLQTSGRPKQELRGEVTCTSWPTPMRIGAAAMGMGAVAASYGLRPSTTPAFRLLTTVLGGALTARALSNRPLTRLAGLRGGQRTLVVDKAITVRRPVRSVFRCFSNFTSFPHFMSHVRSVSPIEEGDIGESSEESVGQRYRWVVDGPAGLPVSWEAEVTGLVPDQLVTWRSVPGALVQNAGRVVFSPIDDETTRIEIHLSYNPVIGILGHAVALLFGVDPRQQMNDDMVRLKTYLETGKPPRDAADRLAGSGLVGRMSHLIH